MTETLMIVPEYGEPVALCPLCVARHINVAFTGISRCANATEGGISESAGWHLVCETHGEILMCFGGGCAEEISRAHARRLYPGAFPRADEVYLAELRKSFYRVGALLVALLGAADPAVAEDGVDAVRWLELDPARIDFGVPPTPHAGIRLHYRAECCRCGRKHTGFIWDNNGNVNSMQNDN
jgi:hypothetical protein